MKREDNYALLLLAGGKNTRMKINKAELLYEGKSFAEQMIFKARRLGITRIYISGLEFTTKEDGVCSVCDQYPDRGPLGGMHACMEAIPAPFCLVLPIDVPQLPLDVLEALLDYHAEYRNGLRGEKEIPLLWEHGDRKEPLIGIYPTAMAEAIENHIKERAVPVFRVLDFWGYECFRKEVSKDTIINVNTPELYRQLIGGSEKESVTIQKIRNGVRCNEEDEVAIERHIEICLTDGRKIQVACTPTYVEELILGRRFLMNDLTPEKAEQGKGTEPTHEPLRKVSMKDIFHIESEMFEKPGALFQDTGCAHSCVLVKDGQVLISMEDIGRHNALDKVIGYAIKNRISIPECAAFCSGRVSEDYLQKAINAGFRIVVSRAAVTGGAVKLAKKTDTTLLGFVRKGSGNVYHEGAVILDI